MAVKKSTKKIAKRSATKKTYPKPKITVDELTAIVADLAKNHAKTEAIIAKSREETDKALRELSAENRKTAAENRKTAAENRKTAAEVRATSVEVRATSATVRELTQNMGGMNNRLGDVIEFLVVPKIRLAMNIAGEHAFDNLVSDREIKSIVDGEKKAVAQMDVFLYNSTESMAVEIKTNLQTKDVKKHLERLQKLRDHEESVGIIGKKLFGAVVGAIVQPDAKAYALANGLYVVEILEEDDKLDVEKPEMCRTW